MSLAILVGLAVGVFAWRSAVGGPSSSIVFPTATSGEVLVTVNGEPITAATIAFFTANGLSQSRALDEVIQAVVRRQAAHRIGVNATDEEAKEFLRRWEATWSAMDAERRLQAGAMLTEQGLATQDIADDPNWLPFGRDGETGVKLEAFLQERLAVAQLTGVPPEGITSLTELENIQAGLDQAALGEAIRRLGSSAELLTEKARFIKEERANAEIVPSAASGCTATDGTVICAGGS